jgi:phosphoribosylanthranilate isomerase
MKKLIQVAGIIDAAEARMIMECGVDYLGFPLRLPVNKEDISEEKAAEIIRLIKSPHVPVLITYLSNAEEIILFCNQLNLYVVQLHGKIGIPELKKIKSVRPDIDIIKSLVVKGDNYSELESTVQNFSPWVDLFITDTFDPVTGASGATGKTHNWEISKMLVSVSPKPVIIAGGLNPSNVRKAILEIKPAGVDVHTGIEASNGRKDFNLLKSFVSEAKQAFLEIDDESSTKKTGSGEQNHRAY